MTERPILFEPRMVRAIRDGRKTQTRRLLEDGSYRLHYHPFEGDVGEDGVPEACWKRSGCLTNVTCPFGKQGDRLWVRERWHPCDSGPVLYAADYETNEEAGVTRWYPSIHLRRVDARIVLEVLAVRIESLQDITERDAIAEGAELARIQLARNPSRGPIVDGFANLWDQINGPRAPWSSNPWVWVVEFRKVKP